MHSVVVCQMEKDVEEEIKQFFLFNVSVWTEIAIKTTWKRWCGHRLLSPQRACMYARVCVRLISYTTGSVRLILVLHIYDYAEKPLAVAVCARDYVAESFSSNGLDLTTALVVCCRPHFSHCRDSKTDIHKKLEHLQINPIISMLWSTKVRHDIRWLNPCCCYLRGHLDCKPGGVSTLLFTLF